MMSALIVSSLILPHGASWEAVKDIGPATSSFETPDSDDCLADETKSKFVSDPNRCLDLPDLSLVKKRKHFSSTPGTLYWQEPENQHTESYGELTKQNYPIRHQKRKHCDY